MERLVLARPVTVTGTDFSGRPAEMTIEPANRPGWFWKIQEPNGDTREVKLEPSLLRHKARRLVLCHEKHRLHVFEHLGALRFTGLDGVRFSSKTPWLPYDGRAKLFWEMIQPHLVLDGAFPIRGLRAEKFERVDSNNGKGLQAKNKVHLRTGESLTVSVHIDYAEWGEKTLVRKFPTTNVRDIFEARSLGNPAVLRRIAEVLKWPHVENVLWTKGVHPDEIIDELLRHRMLDFLGALSVLPESGWFLTGTAKSSCANHGLDIKLVRKFERCLL